MVLRRVRSDLTEVEVDGEIAVYHPGTDRVVLLNASASEIWRRSPISSLDELAHSLSALFGVTADEALAGAEAGVALLQAEQLLVDDDHGTAQDPT